MSRNARKKLQRPGVPTLNTSMRRCQVCFSKLVCVDWLFNKRVWTESGESSLDHIYQFCLSAPPNTVFVIRLYFRGGRNNQFNLATVEFSLLSPICYSAQYSNLLRAEMCSKAIFKFTLAQIEAVTHLPINF